MVRNSAHYGAPFMKKINGSHYKVLKITPQYNYLGSLFSLFCYLLRPFHSNQQ